MAALGRYFDPNKYAADDAGSDVWKREQKCASLQSMIQRQDKEKVERAAKMQAEEVAKGDKTAIEFKTWRTRSKGKRKKRWQKLMGI